MNTELSPQTIEMLRKLLPKADPKYRFSRAERRRKEKQYQCNKSDIPSKVKSKDIPSREDA